MTLLIHSIHWLAGVIVLAEALNKLERTSPTQPGICKRERLLAWLKATAWGLMAIGGAGAVVTPLMQMDVPSLQDMCILLGAAVLIVRTRIEEG